MELLMLVIFLINLLFAAKNHILNELITYEALYYLKVFMLRERDIFSTNSELFYTDNELPTEGKNIKHSAINSYIVYHWINISNFTNCKQYMNNRTI